MTVERESVPDLEQLAAAARRKPTREIAKQRRLIANLKGDLEKHGDADRWKKYGDLLLANASTAERRGDRVIVVDYFDDAAPMIEIEGDGHKAIGEIAEEYFRLYTKARNGARTIASRMDTAE